MSEELATMKQTQTIALTQGQRQAFRDQAACIQGIDEPVYHQFDKDPLEPIIGLGPARARIGFFGRDPGREEVRHGQPFIGAGGQLVRRSLYRHLYGQELPDFAASQAVGEAFFWMNTVPYKPVGNKAWSMKVKRRFQPLMLDVMLAHWQGRQIITLGREAFLWFGMGMAREQRQRLEAFWQDEQRFEKTLDVALADRQGREYRFDLHPLPHPSPLNARWYKHFPALLAGRLQALNAWPGNLLLSRDQDT